MREYLTNQMVDKKKMTEFEKNIEQEQLGMWNRENESHFKKEKDTNERVIYKIIYYLDETTE
jgi:hypothetical protein